MLALSDYKWQGYFCVFFEGLTKRVVEESRKKSKRKGQNYEATKGRREEG